MSNSDAKQFTLHWSQSGMSATLTLQDGAFKISGFSSQFLASQQAFLDAVFHNFTVVADDPADDEAASAATGAEGATAALEASASYNLMAIDDLISALLGDAHLGDAIDGTLTGGIGGDILDGGDGADVLDGGAGIDSASYLNSEAAVIVNLETGIGTGGDAEGDRLISIENLIGSRFDDQLTGDGQDNAFIGGDGADVLDGGAGEDTASYIGSEAAVTVDLTNGTGFGGDADGDRLSNVENLTGSDFGDALTGDDKDNILEGGAGADVLNGGAGEDTASYIGSDAAVTVDLTDGAGSGGDAEGDTLIGIENLRGSAFDDELTGDNRYNILEGGAGADVLNGGAGYDTASYVGSHEGVTVNLKKGTGKGGDAEGDTLIKIERLIGSAFDDKLTGNNVWRNVLEGGAGADVLDGGYGLYDSATYIGSDAGVTVNLTTGEASGGDAEGDTLISIEYLTGSNFDDTLTGNKRANRLEGGEGNDHLHGGESKDYLYGGEGVDTAHYSSSAKGVRVYLSAGRGFGGDAQGDRLYDVENLTGSDFEDTLTGDIHNNRFEGGAGNDHLYGGEGLDRLYGEEGNDHLYGEGDNDHLYGGEGNDHLYGGEGHDWLYGGEGADTFDGGSGYDVVSYSHSQAGVTVNLEAGSASSGDAEGDVFINIELIEASPFKDTLIGNSESNSLNGGDEGDYLYGNGGIDYLYGSYGDDHLYGGDEIDYLFGDHGEDHLFGEGGNDTLYGDGGYDVLEGGVGNDEFRFDRYYLHEIDIITDFGNGDDLIHIFQMNTEDIRIASGHGEAIRQNHYGDSTVEDAILYQTHGTADYADDTAFAILIDYNADDLGMTQIYHNLIIA